MNNAIYISLAQQTALFRNMDVTANNVANVSTPGYKAETMVFEQYLVDDKDNFQRKIAFPQDISTYTDYKDGAATPTGRDLDLAIEGQGFFKVQTPQGIRYTRRGSFHVDTHNELVTAEGYQLLDSGNLTLRIQQTDTNITISSDGTIYANSDNQLVGRVLRGKIDLAHFDNPQKLVKLDNGVYRADEAPDIYPAKGHIIQGSLEQSNVNSVVELTNLININRSVSNVSAFMSDMHDLIRKAITAYTQNV